MPFGREELEYIASLDPRADADMLRRELPGLRPESLRLLEVSTTLLQKCAAAGLSLAEIAAVVTRPLVGLDEDASDLEKICYTARAEVDEEEEEEGSEGEGEEGALPDLDEEGEGEEGAEYGERRRPASALCARLCRRREHAAAWALLGGLRPPVSRRACLHLPSILFDPQARARRCRGRRTPTPRPRPPARPALRPPRALTRPPCP